MELDTVFEFCIFSVKLYFLFYEPIQDHTLHLANSLQLLSLSMVQNDSVIILTRLLLIFRYSTNYLRLKDEGIPLY